MRLSLALAFAVGCGGTPRTADEPVADPPRAEATERSAAAPAYALVVGEGTILVDASGTELGRREGVVVGVPGGPIAIETWSEVGPGSDCHGATGTWDVAAVTFVRDGVRVGVPALDRVDVGRPSDLRVTHAVVAVHGTIVVLRSDFAMVECDGAPHGFSASATFDATDGHAVPAWTDADVAAFEASLPPAVLAAARAHAAIGVSALYAPP